MTKQETTLCFITYVGNCGGTAMEKAIKEFAHKEYEDTIIDEYQRNDVVAALQQKADELAAANPKWKRSKISLGDNTCGGAYLGMRATIYWLRVDNETILTIKKAKGKFSDL
ncbi:MAG: hypothetical protein IJ204_06385 [Paludibacteraceae bacterium]|nr:hypothetical protein [Paludibacteraceae bacterium]